MELSSGPNGNPNEGQNDFLNFFSQAIERYKKSVMESSIEEVKSMSRNVPPKKRSPDHKFNDDESIERPSKLPKVPSSVSYAEPTDSGSDGDNDPKPGDTDVDIEKKRLASRVSSRRTREREKLRMDHFRNAKLKLQQENKKLQDENNEIRSLIQKIKDEKAFLDRKNAVVQSMLATTNQAHSQPPFSLQTAHAANAAHALPTPVISLQPQQQAPPIVPTQQAMAALLLNAIVQPQALNNIPPPVTALPPAQPSQEQQLLSLLGLVTTNPALAQLLAPALALVPQQQPQLPLPLPQQQQQQQQQPQQQPQPMLPAFLQGGFGPTMANNQTMGNNNVLQQSLLNLLLTGGAGGPVGAPNTATQMG